MQIQEIYLQKSEICVKLFLIPLFIGGASLKREEKNKISTQQIKDAAIRLFAKHNSTDISVNELCRDNNISKGKFYHYFASKDDLLMVCASYVIDDVCADIEAVAVSPQRPLEENLRNYYASRISYWVAHTDYFVLISLILNSRDYEFKKRFRPLRAEFDAALSGKTLEILHAANVKKNISDSELLEVMKLVYDNMFLTDMAKIVDALHAGDTAHAQKLCNDLLGLYTRLINVMLYGILSDKPNNTTPPPRNLA